MGFSVSQDTVVVDGYVFVWSSDKPWLDSDAKLRFFNHPDDLGHGRWVVRAAPGGWLYLLPGRYPVQFRAGWYLRPGFPSYSWTGEVVQQYQQGLFA